MDSMLQRKELMWKLKTQVFEFQKDIKKYNYDFRTYYLCWLTRPIHILIYIGFVQIIPATILTLSFQTFPTINDYLSATGLNEKLNTILFFVLTIFYHIVMIIHRFKSQPHGGKYINFVNN